jgi:hypothetical protein
MRKLLARHIEQKPAMPSLGKLARGDILFPNLIGDDQCDLGMAAQDLGCRIGARIVIGDDRIDMSAEIIESIGEKERFVPDARQSNQEMLLPEQSFVAGDDPL